MYKKLLEIKKNKKWLYYLLFIPAIVLIILELYNKYLISSAKKIVKSTEEKDKKLEKQQIQAEVAADFHKQKADEIKKDIKNNKITKDWHLND